MRLSSFHLHSFHKHIGLTFQRITELRIMNSLLLFLNFHLLFFGFFYIVELCTHIIKRLFLRQQPSSFFISVFKSHTVFVSPHTLHFVMELSVFGSTNITRILFFVQHTPGSKHCHHSRSARV
jgi:hypothetical protein